MKSCKFCKKQFKPTKSYYYICNSCVNDCAKCKKCGKVIKAKDNKFTCCNITESSIKPSSIFRDRSLDEVIFKLNNGVFPEHSIYKWEDDENDY